MTSNTDLLLKKGIQYWKGAGCNRDIGLAIKYIKDAISQGSNFGYYALFDVLFEINDDSLKDLIPTIEARAQFDGEAMARMAKAYRDGKGVAQDREKSIYWMSSASQKNISWATNLLFDLYWDDELKKYDTLLYDTIKPLSEEGDAYAVGRLAKMYLYGRGIKLDLSRAYELMSYASKNGVDWANEELMRIKVLMSNCNVEDLADCLKSFYKIYDDSSISISNNSNFVLYDMRHVSMLSQLICLRLIKHPEKKAVLMTTVFHHEDLLTKLEENGIFDKIIISYDIASRCADAIQVLSQIEIYYENLFVNNNLDNFFQIYTGTDLCNPFAIYLSNHKIYYNMIEMFVNQSTSTVRDEMGFNCGFQTKIYSDIQKQSGALSGLNEFCNIIKYNDIGYEHEKMGFNEALTKITDSDKKLILKCFDLNSFMEYKFDFIYVPNSQGYMKYESSGSDPMEVTSLLVDMYYNQSNKIVIKPHPSDNIDYYIHKFKGDVVLPNIFPIELLNLLNNRIGAALTGTSTAIGKLNNIVSKKVYAGQGFFSNYSIIFEIYSILLFLKDKFNNTNVKNFILGTDSTFLETFIKEVIGTADGNYYSLITIDEKQSDSDSINHFYIPVNSDSHVFDSYLDINVNVSGRSFHKYVSIKKI